MPYSAPSPSRRQAALAVALVASAGLVLPPQFSFHPAQVSAQTEPAPVLQAPQPTPSVQPVTAESTPLSVVPLTAIPPRVGDNGELKGKPGEKIQTTLRIRNNSDKPMQIQSIVEDFILGDDGSTPIPLDGSENLSNRWSLRSWVIVSPATQTIPPRQTVAVNVLIEIPEDALPGGHYAMVLHPPTNGKSTDGESAQSSATAINQRVGTLLYVVVDGPINESAFVRNLTFPEFTEYGPIPFSFTVENGSDIHIKPQMNLEIYNMLGKKTDSLTVEGRNIFPLTSRDFSGQWSRVWGFGRYTAELTTSYGAAGQVIVTRTTFWLFPLKLVLAATTLVFTVIGMWAAIRRHLKHRNQIEAERIAKLEEKIQQLETQRTPNTPPSNS